MKLAYLIAGIVALGVVGQMDFEDAIASENHYCEMVTLYKESNGQYGWPDYEDNYDEICNPGNPEKTAKKKGQE